MDTPIAFLIFNRPELTQKVFESIASVQPKKLFIVADGPRNPDEVEKCEQARAVIKQVNWKCEVLTTYSDINLGCKQRITSGLNWVFEQCSEAIILEDDCVPHPMFFRFCTELLEKYRYDDRIMAISGNNFQYGKKRGKYSYYFSNYAHIWGWATWKSSWDYYDVSMSQWPYLKKTSWLMDMWKDIIIVKYWENVFDEVYSGQIDAWDQQWLFSVWFKKGLTILPNVNLVTNIGFGINATHTTTHDHLLSNMAIEAMKFPLRHPQKIVRNVRADKNSAIKVFLGKEYEKLVYRLKKRIKLYIRKWIGAK